MTNQIIDLIQTQTQDLLDQLQVKAEVSVVYDDQAGYYQIQMETEIPGLIIGYRGETLSAFQLILNLLVNRKISSSTDDKNDTQKTWHKIIVNVGDYRQKREETLKQLAKNAAQRVAFSGEPYVLDHLTPGERRIVHLALQEEDNITTYSEGEGRHRRLVVAPK